MDQDWVFSASPLRMRGNGLLGWCIEKAARTWLACLMSGDGIPPNLTGSTPFGSLDLRWKIRDPFGSLDLRWKIHDPFGSLDLQWNIMLSNTCSCHEINDGFSSQYREDAWKNNRFNFRRQKQPRSLIDYSNRQSTKVPKYQSTIVDLLIYRSGSCSIL